MAHDTLVEIANSLRLKRAKRHSLGAGGIATRAVRIGAIAFLAPVLVFAGFALPVTGAASAATLWGIDSCDPAQQVVPATQQDMGTPQFMGRYLGTNRCGTAGLSSTEVTYLHSQNAAVLLIADPGGFSGANGTAEANTAIQQAQSLGAPAGTAIFRDVEQGDSITASYVLAWYNAFAQSASGYVAAFYENPINGPFSGAGGAYCSAVSSNSAIASHVVLWSDELEPEYGVQSYSPTRANALGWNPSGPACANTTAAWQYEQRGGFPSGSSDPNVDVDEVLAQDQSLLWGSAPPPPNDNLGFIKLKNTAGTVEVHVDALASSGKYQRTLDAVSDFSTGDASNGRWELFGSVNGAPELGFIKLKNTAGTVEVHVDALASSGKYQRMLDAVTDFSAGDASNGRWELFGSGNGAPELGFIKLKNTARTVEVHVDALASSGKYQRTLDAVSDFSTGDASNGRWDLFGGAANSAPELGFIKLKNTAGTVEVHVDALASSGKYQRTLDAVSDFSLADASNGAWNLIGLASSAPELAFVKLRNTAGTVEVHMDALASSGKYQRTLDAVSDFSLADATNGSWQLGTP